MLFGSATMSPPVCLSDYDTLALAVTIQHLGEALAFSLPSSSHALFVLTIAAYYPLCCLEETILVSFAYTVQSQKGLELAVRNLLLSWTRAICAEILFYVRLA